MRKKIKLRPVYKKGGSKRAIAKVQVGYRQTEKEYLKKAKKHIEGGKL